MRDNIEMNLKKETDWMTRTD